MLLSKNEQFCPLTAGLKGNPWVDFLMVVMASSIARGRVIATTTTETHDMAVILQTIGRQRHAALVYRVILWYWTSMLWSIDTCQNKASADQFHVTISWAQVYSSSRSRVFCSWPLTKCWFLIGSRAHVRFTCWKQGRIFRKPVNASPGLKFSRLNFFFLYKCFLLLCFEYMVIIKLKTESQTINRKPHHKVTRLKSTFNQALNNPAKELRF